MTLHVSEAAAAAAATAATALSLSSFSCSSGESLNKRPLALGFGVQAADDAQKSCLAASSMKRFIGMRGEMGIDWQAAYVSVQGPPKSNSTAT